MGGNADNKNMPEGNNDPEAAREEFYAESRLNVLDMSGRYKAKLRNLNGQNIDDIERIERAIQNHDAEMPKGLAERINKIPGLSASGNEIHINAELLAWGNMRTIEKMRSDYYELFSGIFEILEVGIGADRDWAKFLNTRIDDLNKRIDDIERAINGQ